MITFTDQLAPGSNRPFSPTTPAGRLVLVSGHTAPHDLAKGINRGALGTSINLPLG